MGDVIGRKTLTNLVPLHSGAPADAYTPNALKSFGRDVVGRNREGLLSDGDPGHRGGPSRPDGRRDPAAADQVGPSQFSQLVHPLLERAHGEGIFFSGGRHAPALQNHSVDSEQADGENRKGDEDLRQAEAAFGAGRLFPRKGEGDCAGLPHRKHPTGAGVKRQFQRGDERRIPEASLVPR